MAEVKPGTGGDHYIPYEERKGNESIVYFTRDLSAEGLKKIYEKISANLTGKIAVKLHTGEKHGPNILPRPWVKELLEKEIPDATIIETNTYYEGDRPAQGNAEGQWLDLRTGRLHRRRIPRHHDASGQRRQMVRRYVRRQRPSGL